MNDELILFGNGLDQSLPTEEESQWIKERVDQRVEAAIKNANLEEATNLVRSLIKVAKIAGRELTKVLYQFKTNWSVFDTEETFEEWADRESGLHHHTVERYIRIEALFTNTQIPAEIRSELSDKNLTELFPIANMMEQGYELDQDEWESIIQQPDEVSIRTKIREIKGQPPRASALVMMIDGNGSLWVTKDNVKKFVGSLEITDTTPIVQQAIDRIVRNSGVLR